LALDSPRRHPVKAGISPALLEREGKIPACAGMTEAKMPR
jgi:hypothetical protein